MDGYYSSVFQLSPAMDGEWNYTVISIAPTSILDNFVFDSSGNLYGMGINGGHKGNGYIGELIAGRGGSWHPRLIHLFWGGQDGGYPYGGLSFDPISGNLFGAATGNGGGQTAMSTVFQLTPGINGKWNYDLIYRFCCYDQPYGNVLVNSSDDLYGTTFQGGINRWGVVFELKRGLDGTWVESDIYDFTGGLDGGSPQAGLVRDSSGNLYGTTRSGGESQYWGNVFEFVDDK